jgi:hypothetical protein
MDGCVCVIGDGWVVDVCVDGWVGGRWMVCCVCAMDVKGSLMRDEYE